MAAVADTSRDDSVADTSRDDSVDDTSRDDSVAIIWNIQNFSLNTRTQGQSILSPEFEVEKLGSSCWQMELFPEGSYCKDYIAYSLIPRMKDSTVEWKYYNLTLSITAGKNELAKDGELWWAKPSENWMRHQLLKRDLLPNPLPNDTLSICCMIEPKPYLPPIDGHQMESLSQNLIDLLESGRHHDLVLETDDGERFKVHKCVMSVRWPNLLCSSSTKLGTNYRDCETEIRVHGVASSVMKTMIRYAYSGTLKPSIQRDVFKSAVNTNFITLRKNLTTFPKMYSAVTNFKVEHKTVVWHLDDISSWDTATPSFIRILPITQLHMQEIVLFFSIKTDEDGDEAIDIAFRFANILKPTILKCKLSLSVAKDITSPFKSGEHLFETKDFWHFPQLFKKRDIPDKKRSLLTMDLTLSDGPTTGIIEESEIDFFNHLMPIQDLRKLSTDIATLTSVTVDTFPTDCVLQCLNGSDIGTHHAVLWARWPQLSSVNGVGVNEIMKNNISSSELRNILKYIYSGNSEAITKTTAEKLMEINRTSRLPSPMLEMCKSILKTTPEKLEEINRISRLPSAMSEKLRSMRPNWAGLMPNYEIP